MAETWGNHVAIVVDGILKHPGDVSSIIPGIMLYKSLVKDHRVSLIFDSGAKEKIQYWLIMNSLTDHTREVYWEDYDSHDTAERRMAQISRLRKDGPLSLVYESDAEAAAALFKDGVPSMLFLHPSYTHPDFRPDSNRELTPWNVLVQEQVRQREARATDTRLDLF